MKISRTHKQDKRSTKKTMKDIGEYMINANRIGVLRRDRNNIKT